MIYLDSNVVKCLLYNSMKRHYPLGIHFLYCLFWEVFENENITVFSP